MVSGTPPKGFENDGNREYEPDLRWWGDVGGDVEKGNNAFKAGDVGEEDPAEIEVGKTDVIVVVGDDTRMFPLPPPPVVVEMRFDPEAGAGPDLKNIFPSVVTRFEGDEWVNSVLH